MLLSFGLYWTQWGAWFALGVVVSIYIHEMGHVAALRRYGIAASAPMFIPGFGAIVRLKQSQSQSPRKRARGAGGARCGARRRRSPRSSSRVSPATRCGWRSPMSAHGSICSTSCRSGSSIGNRGFASLVRVHRWYAVGALILAWALWPDGLFLLLILSGRSSAPPGKTRRRRG
jgi:hypothetical protein